MLFKSLQKELASDRSSPWLYAGQDPPLEDRTLVEQLGGDVDLYDDVIRKDGHANAVIAKVESGIISQGFRVVPAKQKRQEQKAAQLVEEVFARGIEDDACRSLWDAVGKGYSFAEIFWEQRDGFIVPHAVVPRPQFRFRFKLLDEADADSDAITKVGGYGIKLLTKTNPTDGEWLKGDKHRKILSVSYGSRSGNPYGRGLYECAYWLATIRKQLAKFALVAADKYASPVPYAIFEPGTSESVVEEFLDNISQGAWGKLPSGVQVAFLEAARNGVSDYHQLITLFADEMSKLFLGSTLTVQLGEVGSFAAAQQHSKEEDKAIKNYCRVLCHPLNTLARWIAELNYPSAMSPIILVNEGDEDLNIRAQRDEMIAKAAGRQLDPDYLEEKYGVRFLAQTEVSGITGTTLTEPVSTERPRRTPLPVTFAEPMADIDQALDSLTDRAIEQTQPIIQNWNKTIANILEDIETDPKFANKKDSAKYAEASRRLSAIPGLDKRQLNEIMGQVMTLGRAIGEYEIQQFIDNK